MELFNYLLLIVAFCLLHSIAICSSADASANLIVHKPLLYPYGLDHGDKALPHGDDLSVEIKLDDGDEFPFAKGQESKIFVNLDGGLSFGEGIDSYWLLCSRADEHGDKSVQKPGRRLIAPFWADIHTQQNLGGEIFYRTSTTDHELLEEVSRDVNTALKLETPPFKFKWVLVATWVNVTYFGAKYCFDGLVNDVPRNTFQVALVTDGKASFAIFNYGALGWTSWLRYYCSDEGSEVGGCSTFLDTRQQAFIGYHQKATGAANEEDSPDSYRLHHLPQSCNRTAVATFFNRIFQPDGFTEKDEKPGRIVIRVDQDEDELATTTEAMKELPAKLPPSEDQLHVEEESSSTAQPTESTTVQHFDSTVRTPDFSKTTEAVTQRVQTTEPEAEVTTTAEATTTLTTDEPQTATPLLTTAEVTTVVEDESTLITTDEPQTTTPLPDISTLEGHMDETTTIEQETVTPHQVVDEQTTVTTEEPITKTIIDFTTEEPISSTQVTEEETTEHTTVEVATETTEVTTEVPEPSETTTEQIKLVKETSPSAEPETSEATLKYEETTETPTWSGEMLTFEVTSQYTTEEASTTLTHHVEEDTSPVTQESDTTEISTPEITTVEPDTTSETTDTRTEQDLTSTPETTTEPATAEPITTVEVFETTSVHIERETTTATEEMTHEQETTVPTIETSTLAGIDEESTTPKEQEADTTLLSTPEPTRPPTEDQHLVNETLTVSYPEEESGNCWCCDSPTSSLGHPLARTFFCCPTVGCNGTKEEPKCANLKTDYCAPVEKWKYTEPLCRKNALHKCWVSEDVIKKLADGQPREFTRRTTTTEMAKKLQVRHLITELATAITTTTTTEASTTTEEPTEASEETTTTLETTLGLLSTEEPSTTISTTEETTELLETTTEEEPPTTFLQSTTEEETTVTITTTEVPMNLSCWCCTTRWKSTYTCCSTPSCRGTPSKILCENKLTGYCEELDKWAQAPPKCINPVSICDAPERSIYNRH